MFATMYLAFFFSKDEKFFMWNNLVQGAARPCVWRVAQEGVNRFSESVG